MKPALTTRRALLATLLAGSTLVSTGCTTGGMSLASLNPFSKAAPDPSAVGSQATESIAGSENKSAFGKATDAVVGVFKREPSPEEKYAANDPLSLNYKPKVVGPEVYVANGQLWESTGDYDKAMESYGKALQSEANHAPALTSIARLHFRQNNHKMAADYFQKAIAQSPNDAGLHNDLGLTLSKLGNHQAASQSLQQALSIAPKTSRYANNLATVRFEAGDSQGAFQVLATNNKPAVAHFNMAYLYYKSGNNNEARQHLNQALQFKSQATTDATIQRAVERSQDMLAQIDGNAAPVTQAAPTTKIASSQYFTQPPQGSAVKQTSQSSQTTSGVAPASTVSPAPTTPTTASATAAITVPTVNPALATQDAATATSTLPAETAGLTWGVSASKPEGRPMPVKPSAETATPQGDAQQAETSDPAIPFSLPTSFLK